MSLIAYTIFRRLTSQCGVFVYLKLPFASLSGVMFVCMYVCVHKETVSEIDKFFEIYSTVSPSEIIVSGQPWGALQGNVCMYVCMCMYVV